MAKHDDMENATVGRKNDDEEKDKKKKKQEEDEATKDKKNADENDQNDEQDKDSDDDESGGKNKKDGKSKLGSNMAKAGAAAQGGAAAGQAMMMAQLLQWLKIFLEMMRQLITAAAAAVMSAVQAVVAVVVQVATAVAAAVGVSVVAATFGIVGLAVLAVVVVAGVVISAINANEVSKLDGALPDCAEVVEKAKDEAADINPSAAQLENAQLAYSFYSTYGAPDEHIAGILGNWSCESGIDPTSIECDYLFCSGEDYVSGPKKTEIFADLNNYTLNKVFPAYASSNLSINQNAYRASDGKYYCGLGLGQWTGPRGLLLVQAAEAADLDWYSMEMQLIFSISTDTSANTLRNWFAVSESNPSTAAEYFMRNWEGIVNSTLSNRQSRAEQWYVQMAEWEADVDYANSLIELAGVVKMEASDNGVSGALDDCESERLDYDNSSIAHAAVSYAYVNYEDSKQDNGTPLYQTVHDVVYPGDPYYASCDRGAACAVKWSGYDTSFPAGACSTQYSYCSSSPKWKKISWGGDTDKLLPGDILICNSCHTLMYTGHEIIREVWGDEEIDALPKYSSTVAFVEASYGNRSPGLVPLWGNYVSGVANGEGHVHNFAAFRCIDPDMSDIYDNAADGVDTHVSVRWEDSPYG